MPKNTLPTSPNPLIALSFLCLGPLAFAQQQEMAEPEEELQTITLDRGSVEEADEERFDDMVFDEETQSYRLIEDDGGDDWIEPPSEREVQADELKRLFDLYKEALDNKDFLEADTLAKRVVELSIQLNGLDSHDSAKAITNLGIAQHNNGDYESALQNFQSSIEIVERIDDNLSAALINPLQGLAATQAAIGRPDMARLSYQRAVHVSHVNEGPHNPDQVKILESVAELHISQGSFEEAEDIQEHIFSIQSRKIDPKSLDMIPALKKRAEWQHRLQRYHRERITWRQIISIVERNHGPDSLEMIPPLIELGKSYLFVSPAEYDYQPDVSVSSGESYLRRAHRIAERNPDATWQMLENTALSLGDYYILSGRPSKAEKTYAGVWTMLSEGGDPEKMSARRDHLERVKVLQRVFPPKYYNSLREEIASEPPESFQTGTMSFNYTVLASGRVTQVKHLETQPGEITDFDQVVGRSLRRMVYRPRMEDGKIVQTSDLVYSHEFYYRPSDVPSTPAVTVETVADEESETE